MSTRRFIAGAVCPDCGMVDKLVLFVGSADNRRECVNCGYQDGLVDTPSLPEPATRVNRPRPGDKVLPHEQEIQRLKFAGDTDSESRG